MDPTPPAPVDLVALMAHINTLVPANAPDAPIVRCLMGYAVRRLHTHGHTDVELLAVLNSTPFPQDRNKPNTTPCEGHAFALRQGDILVGACGARTLSDLTATAQRQVNDDMAINPRPTTTRVVVGDDALRLIATLSPRAQAELNAVVDNVCLSQAVAQPALGRPTARM